MGLILTFVYLAYMLISPVTWFPELASMKVQAYIGVLALVVTTPKFLKHNVFQHTPQIVLATLLFILSVCSPILNLWFGGIVKAFSDLIPLLVLLFLVRMNCEEVVQRRRFVIALVILMTCLAFAGVYYFHTDPNGIDNKFVFRSHFDGKNGSSILYRLKGQGLLDDPNDFAQAMLICAALSTMLWDVSFLMNAVLVVIPSIVLAYAVLLTHSRGALVATAAIVACSLRRKLKVWGSVVIGALLLAGFALSPNLNAGRQISVDSGVDRLDIWSDGLGLLKQSHLMGVAYGQFTDVVGITAHNSVLLVACELGLIGLVLFVALWVLSFTQLNRISAAVQNTVHPTLWRECRSLELSLVAFCATSWFLSRAFSAMPFLLLGLVSSFVAQQAEDLPEIDIIPRWTAWLRMSVGISLGALVTIYLMVRMRST